MCKLVPHPKEKRTHGVALFTNDRPTHKWHYLTCGDLELHRHLLIYYTLWG